MQAKTMVVLHGNLMFLCQFKLRGRCLDILVTLTKVDAAFQEIATGLPTYENHLDDLIVPD